MNKVELINGSGISECFSNICLSDSVEIEFELENRGIESKADIQDMCKYLNRLYNEKKIYVKEWVLVSHYSTGVLLKGTEGQNVKYIKITKGGE